MNEEIRRWWIKANDDFDKAKILYENGKYDGASFFCQQAVEKGLKALLIKEKNQLKKIHDLVELGREVGMPKTLIDFCKELTLSYIYSRYPDIQEAKNIKDISAKFLIYTKEILKWTKKKIIRKKLKEFKELVNSDLPISKMYFFGSRAIGKAHKYSDIDLLIVSPKFKNLNFFKRGAKMYDYWNLRYPVDFLCYTPEEFNKLKKQITIVREVVREGIEI